MIELLIAACLATGDCREVSLLYDPHEVTLLTCIMSGQAEVARWQAQHPAWQVQGWRCGLVGERERDA